MLRPNSPRPPSGTTSTGGAPADTGCAMDTLMRHPSRTRRRVTRAQGIHLREALGGKLLERPGRVRSGRRSGRWESLEKRAGFAGNYSTAQRYGREQGAPQVRPFRPARASPDGASDRCPPPPAPRRDPRPRSTPNGFSAFCIVFRRCVNIDRTMRTNSFVVGDRHLRRPKREPDDGRMHLRRRAKRARRQGQHPRHVGVERGQHRQHAVVAGADLAPPDDRPLPSAASASRPATPPVVAASSSSGNRIGDEML